jgi:hypothetical protein
MQNTMDIVIILRVEEKEDETGDGVQPNMPSATEVANHYESHLQDVSKHDGTIGWRITSCTARRNTTS